MQKAAANQAMLIPENGTQQGGGSAPDDEGRFLKGKTAPGFTLTSLDGKKVSLSDYKGRAVLLNFWATWCAPCKIEMPWFEQFRQQYKDQGFEILGVAEDDAGKDEIEKSVKKIGVTYPILLADGKVAPKYGGVDYLPMSFFIDKNGVVVEETAGLASKDEIEANIKKAIASNLTASTAGGR